jgi:predicted ATPase with chaperone activity
MMGHRIDMLRAVTAAALRARALVECIGDDEIEMMWATANPFRSKGRGARRVEQARERQRARSAVTELQCNRDMGPSEVRQHCVIDVASNSLLRAAMQQMQMSGRAFRRILKLARTIADLADSERVETAHLAEAIQYRPRKQI